VRIVSETQGHGTQGRGTKGRRHPTIFTAGQIA
jgi:hypothetical protein